MAEVVWHVTWPEVEQAPHRFGGVEFRLGTRELGHIHGDALVDVPFPRRVRDELVAAGRARAHHVLPTNVRAVWRSPHISAPAILGSWGGASAVSRNA
jgi:Luciferase